MDINLDDKFILHKPNRTDLRIKVVNINDFRPPDMKFALEVFDENGNAFDDVCFVGDDFFIDNNLLSRGWCK